MKLKSVETGKSQLDLANQYNTLFNEVLNNLTKTDLYVTKKICDL